MGKHKKDRAVKGARSNPIAARSSLADQIVSDRIVDPSDTKLRSKSRAGKDKDDPEFLDEKMTQKILKQARRQQQNPDGDILDDVIGSRQRTTTMDVSLGNAMTLEDSDDSDDDEFAVLSKRDRTSYDEDIEIDPEDEKALELFMKKGGEESKSLGELIKEKFTEKQTELESQFSETGLNVKELEPLVQELYEGVKLVASRYRSGKLPKAFKIIPRLTNWEQILHITDPPGWTAALMYQATRIFASNLKENMAQRFYNLVLLPRIRDDIVQYKKLNFHLYQALRKALFKPGAFMKGMVLPLLESGTCTLREAVIIGSVLSKNSVPILHSSAALIRIAEMDYTGASSIFLRVLLDKKYALPYRVIDAVVYHFLKFEHDKRELPVLWHQAFLVFVQRYKEHMSSEQKEALHALLRAQSHPQITGEIRRELQNSKCRDDVKPTPPQNGSINDVSME